MDGDRHQVNEQQDGDEDRRKQEKGSFAKLLLRETPVFPLPKEPEKEQEPRRHQKKSGVQSRRRIGEPDLVFSFRKREGEEGAGGLGKGNLLPIDCGFEAFVVRNGEEKSLPLLRFAGNGDPIPVNGKLGAFRFFAERFQKGGIQAVNAVIGGFYGL